MVFKSILFSDFDGTLCEHQNPGNTVKNLSAVKRWREAGNLFVIITGRGEESLRSILPDYKDFSDYCIFCDGVMINYPHDHTYCLKYFGEDLANRINDIFSSCSFGHERTMICFEPGAEHDRATPDTCKVRLWFTSEIDCAMSEKIFKDNFSNELEFLTYYSVTFNDDTRLHWVKPEMRHIIEVTAKNIDKSRGINELLCRLGISNPNRIITIGDGKNDIGMIRDFDGYAVKHAPLDVLVKIPDSNIVPHLYSLIDKKLSP